MTERKPAGISFETWVDRQIREAEERGEFSDLPGRGKPLASLDEPADDLWWVKAWLRRENLSITPPALALRKAVEDLPALLAGERSEARVRALIGELNDEIRAANRIPVEGPPSSLMPLDVEQTVARWREDRAASAVEEAGPTIATVEVVEVARPRRWLRRRPR